MKIIIIIHSRGSKFLKKEIFFIKRFKKGKKRYILKRNFSMKVNKKNWGWRINKYVVFSFGCLVKFYDIVWILMCLFVLENSML